MKTHLTALLILTVLLVGFAAMCGILYLIAVQDPYYLFLLMLLVALALAYRKIYEDLKDKEEDEQVGPFNSGGRD